MKLCPATLKPRTMQSGSCASKITRLQGIQCLHCSSLLLTSELGLSSLGNRMLHWDQIQIFEESGYICREGTEIELHMGALFACMSRKWSMKTRTSLVPVCFQFFFFLSVDNPTCSFCFSQESFTLIFLNTLSLSKKWILKKT